ncbi:Serine-aspartate repeat-containing protein F [bacterium HR25]|nr:Serine-aspartate repeat-containing protein F [bacterium HR25]
MKETLQDGWRNTTSLCQNVTLSPGGSATVSFGNQELATLTVVKVVEGQAPDDDWGFSGDLGDFTLPGGGGQRTFSDLDAGEYTVSETTKPGYDVSVECDNGATGGSSVTVELGPGEDVTCTFTNVARPVSITAHKFSDLNGDGDQDGGEPDLSGWEMTLYAGSGCTGTVQGTGTTDDSGNLSFVDLQPGAYSVKETLQDGWRNTTSLCQNVTLSPGGSATVSFGNQELATLTVVKVVEGQAPDDDWGFSGDLGDFTLPGGGGQRTFSDLDAGEYTVSETTKPGYDVSVECDNGATGGSSVTVELGPGEDVTCTFTNVARPVSITAHKFSDLNGDGDQDGGEPDLSGWEMTLYSGDACEGGAVGTGTTGQDGTVTFTGLDAGVYSVGEGTRDGWRPTTPTCRTVELEPGQEVVVSFGNQELATLTVVKAVEGLVPGSTWSFTVTGDSGTQALSFAAAGGSQSLVLVPGEYGVQETTKPGYDVSVECDNGATGGSSVTVELGAGDAVLCIFTNSLPIQAGIDLEKSASPTSGEAPLQVTYTLTARNTGNVTLTNVTITDEALGLLNVPCGDGTLEPGESCQVQATKTYTKAGTFPNTAVVRGQFDGGEVSDSDTANVTVSQVGGVIIRELPRGGGGPAFQMSRGGLYLLGLGLAAAALAVTALLPLLRRRRRS